MDLILTSPEKSLYSQLERDWGWDLNPELTAKLMWPLWNGVPSSDTMNSPLWWLQGILGGDWGHWEIME